MLAQSLPVVAPPPFEAFSTTHAAVAGLCSAIMLTLVILGLRSRGTFLLTRVTNAWLLIVLIVQTANIIFFALPQNLRWDTSLPLHICDLVGWVAFFALWMQRRILRTILYFWGLGLTTQAFITPTIDTGPDTVKFWLFWASHLTIVGSAIYDVAVLRYRPTWRDLGVIALVMIGYGIIIIPFDLSFGFNYGYIGNTRPTSPTLIDRLGDWPLRLLWMWLISHACFLLLTATWYLPRLLRPRPTVPRTSV